METRVLCLDLGIHTGYVTNTGKCGTWTLDKPKNLLCHEYLFYRCLERLWNTEKFHVIVCEDVYIHPRRYSALGVLYGLLGVARCFAATKCIGIVMVQAVQARREVFGKTYYKTQDLIKVLCESKFAGIIDPADRHQRDATVLLLWWYRKYESEDTKCK